jgi:hypothetical protein
VGLIGHLLLSSICVVRTFNIAHRTRMSTPKTNYFEFIFNTYK